MDASPQMTAKSCSSTPAASWEGFRSLEQAQRVSFVWEGLEVRPWPARGGRRFDSMADYDAAAMRESRQTLKLQNRPPILQL
jgi:hypothetical protein